VTDPFALFASWWAEEQVPVVVATASPDGAPTARAVVLEQFDERGFVFWTSSESTKGRQLAANPRAALVFLWDGRQVRVEGRVERVSAAEDARHWAGRDGKRPIAAFRQSEPVASRAELERLVAETPEEPERPAFWAGYRVVPERFDVWEVDPDFVHDRHEFVRSGDGWTARRLQP
jgi:pyridoxamine 5'-phosphate oxidase